MKPILSVIFVAAFFFVTSGAFAQQTSAEGGYYGAPVNEKIPNVAVTDSTPGVTQNVTNQDLQMGLHVLITKVDALAQQCTAPDSPDCSQAIVAAEQKAREIVKKDGLTPKEKRQVRRIFDEAITAANVGDTAAFPALRAELDQMKADIAGLKTDVAGLKTDVAGLKTDVAALKSGETSAQSGTMTAADASAYTEAQRNSIVAKTTADQAKATAEEAKRLAEEAKAAAEANAGSGGVSQDALTEALTQAADAQAAAELAQRAAEEAKARADEVAAKQADGGNVDSKADAEAKRLAEEAKTASTDALDKAQTALAGAKGLQGQIDSLKTEIAGIRADLDKKQDANEISVGLGYFSTPKIFAPTLVLSFVVKRGNLQLGINAEMGYHFFYGDVYYEPEVRILMNYDLGVSYQFVDWFSAGLGVFSFSAGQAYSDTFGFGLEAHTRFSWRLNEIVGMSIELWGGPDYNWAKETLSEPPGTLTTEVFRAVETNSSISGAFGLRTRFDF